MTEKLQNIVLPVAPQSSIVIAGHWMKIRGGGLYMSVVFKIPDKRPHSQTFLCRTAACKVHTAERGLAITASCRSTNVTFLHKTSKTLAGPFMPEFSLLACSVLCLI